MDFSKVKMVIDDPGLLFLELGHRGFFGWMSDERYLKAAYKVKMGIKPDLDHPVTYTEKLQWLKLHDRNPMYINMVDKYEAGNVIGRIIGKEYIIPCLGVWDSFDEIPFSALPDRFVLKCTHDSGGVAICTDKKSFDIRAAKRRIEKCLRSNYFNVGREWPYKYIKPRIIAEELIEDSASGDLRDYKFFTFNGEVKAVYVVSGRNTGGVTTADFFSPDGTLLPIMNGHPNSEVPPELPAGFEKMKELASGVGKGIPHVRVDFYEANGRIWFGETTFYHWSGLMPFVPEEWDRTFGSWIKLPGEQESAGPECAGSGETKEALL